MSTSKDYLTPEQLSLAKKEALNDNWKNYSAYIKTSQTEKTNSVSNYEL